MALRNTLVACAAIVATGAIAGIANGPRTPWQESFYANSFATQPAAIPEASPGEPSVGPPPPDLSDSDRTGEPRDLRRRDERREPEAPRQFDRGREPNDGYGPPPGPDRRQSRDPRSDERAYPPPPPQSVEPYPTPEQRGY